MPDGVGVMSIVAGVGAAAAAVVPGVGIPAPNMDIIGVTPILGGLNPVVTGTVAKPRP